MALQTITTFKGLAIDAGYFRVLTVRGDKDKFSFTVGLYKDKEAEKITEFSYTTASQMNGDNFIKQAYTHLKTLPEFADATDV
jgi:hypothetical protein